MTIYQCDDGNCQVEIEADTPLEAAQEYVDSGSWNRDRTSWITVYVWTEDRDAAEPYTITLKAEEPPCTSDRHDWQSPHAIVGGLKENPGVFGHGGGAIINECCMNCGCKRTVDTWAQNPDTGAQGLRSVEYTPRFYNLPTEA